LARIEIPQCRNALRHASKRSVQRTEHHGSFLGASVEGGFKNSRCGIA